MTADYSPPTPGEMKCRQNEDDCLRLLIAQRRLHDKAKFWQALRWIGVLMIGVAAPVIAVIWQDAAVLVGAIAGVWLFLGRTLLAWLVAKRTGQGAATQEAVDQYIFAMPRLVDRHTLPIREDIAALAGPDSALRDVAAKEDLLNWYPIEEGGDGAREVAIAQRANASYSNRLLKLVAWSWSVVALTWGIALVVATTLNALSTAEFLLGVVLPVLPAVLDAIESIQNIARAARDRGDVARTIEAQLTSSIAITSEQLLVWQDQMYDLRRRTPQVPNVIYKVVRSKNEDAMKSAAKQLRQPTGTAN